MKICSSCVLAVSLLLLAPPRPARADAVVLDGVAKAVVHVRATRPGVVVSELAGRVEGFEDSAALWKDICVAPCSFEMQSGPHDLRLGGDTHTPSAETFRLNAGDNYLVAKPGSRFLWAGGWLTFSLGLTGLAGGTVLLVNDGLDAPAMALLLGSAALGIGGLTMVSAGSSSWEREDPPALPPARLLSYHGRF